uniref:glycosyltransferase n=1 Tax=Pedobacter schmidteae TaxID=2201271 RepID=UPI000EB1ADB0|nr:glycosyltransferase [Pedobacter schmidteae]
MTKHTGRKLLFVVNSLDGGVTERMIANLCNYFDNHEYEVSIVCLNKTYRAYFLGTEIKISALKGLNPDSRLINKLWYIFSTFFRLIALLRRYKPNMVISFKTSANLWAGITCSLLTIPYVLSERITEDTTFIKLNRLLTWFFLKIYNNAKMVVVPSKRMTIGFGKGKHFKPIANCEVISYPVNQLRPLVARGVHKRKFILAAGRLDDQKSFAHLITAFKGLSQQDVDLLVLGEGGEFPKLEAQIKQMGMQHRIMLIGFKECLQDYYKEAQLFVLSARDQSYSSIVAEAMNLGCTCIATDCEQELSDSTAQEKNGLLVKVNGLAHLTEAMNLALSNSTAKKGALKHTNQDNKTTFAEITSAKWEKLIQQIL